jgi:hypothetical protein
VGGREPDERSELESRLNPDASDDLISFGWLRGIRDRATMLELRKKNGNILAVGYGWLEKAEFDPSQGITLHVGGQTIRITGRNLNTEVRPNVRLFEGITRHRVSWLREAGEAQQMEADPATPIVDAIEW